MAIFFKSLSYWTSCCKESGLLTGRQCLYGYSLYNSFMYICLMPFYTLILCFTIRRFFKNELSWLALSKGIYVKIQTNDLFWKTGRPSLSDPRKRTSWSFNSCVLHCSLLPTNTVVACFQLSWFMLLVQ